MRPDALADALCLSAIICGQDQVNAIQLAQASGQFLGGGDVGQDHVVERARRLRSSEGLSSPAMKAVRSCPETSSVMRDPGTSPYRSATSPEIKIAPG